MPNTAPTTMDPVTVAGKILLMDDDTSILRLAALMLERCGYQVTTSHNGEEAISCYQESMAEDDKYDLIIMDLTIPGHMGAKDAMQAILNIDDKAVGIVSSGHSADTIILNYEQFGFQGALVKPFLMDELAQLVKTVIQKSLGAYAF